MEPTKQTLPLPEPKDPKDAFETALEVNLTVEEVAVRAQQHASATQELEQLEVALVDWQAAMKATKGTMESEIVDGKRETRRLARIVKLGTEPRQVRCKREYDYKQGVVRSVRLDTAVIIGIRAMNEDEKQRPLPFEKPLSAVAEAGLQD